MMNTTNTYLIQEDFERVYLTDSQFIGEMMMEIEREYYDWLYGDAKIFVEEQEEKEVINEHNTL